MTPKGIGLVTGLFWAVCGWTAAGTAAEEYPKPYSLPCTEREQVFAFSEPPVVVVLGEDRYQISFASKGNCDVTVAIVDDQGRVVRHLGSGVLGPNAPAPFQKNALKQTVFWNGKDDLDNYVKEPGRLRAKVMLGLKPVFERLLGDAQPENLPGMVLGIAVQEGAAYVWVRGQGGMGHVTVKKFDLEGRYQQTLAPPPTALPEASLGGRSYVEWEPGKRGHFGPLLMEDLGYDGQLLPGVGGKGVLDLQPVIIGKRMYFCNAGPGYKSGDAPSMCYYLHTDGSSEVRGLRERLFMPGGMGHENPRLAASPDGKWIYVTGVGTGSKGTAPVVMRMAVEGEGLAELLVGKASFKGKTTQSTPGSDNESLNNPVGLDTDPQGRIYVCDHFNNRVQIFSPEGKYLATLPADRPRLVCIHKKSGAIYLQHMGQVKGRSVPRLTKFHSLEKPVAEASVDGIETAVMALDSGSPRPRLWIGGGLNRTGVTTTSSYYDRGPGVTVWEEQGASFKEIVNLDAQVRSRSGEDYLGRWEGSCYDKVVCDPVREQLWWCWEKNQGSRVVFDLGTGKLQGEFSLYGATDDIAFCKRGYLHTHFNPGFYMPGVGRLDPSRKERYTGMGAHWRLDRARVFTLSEVPYDYGFASDQPNQRAWAGILPVKDQPGAKFFQDGFGVNMRGDIAEQCNLYYAPKMEEAGWASADAGRAVRDLKGQGSGPSRYSEFLRSIQELEKKGEQAYFLRRQPGVAVTGATIWTFDATGELRQECAVVATTLAIGSFIDEDGCLYFANDAGKMIDGKPFLFRRAGNLGTEEPLSKYNRTPVTYTYLKCRLKEVRWLLKKSAVPMEPPPQRPTELVSYGPFGPPQLGGGEMWTTGVDWLYAGYSPAVSAGCTCPSTRAHLDWYKRSFVPEGYRRSIGILDTNGNLILHLGRYGNYDDAWAMKPGSEDIALTLPRFIGGTDNYLGFDDWGERLVVLKLAYQVEALAPIGAR